MNTRLTEVCKYLGFDKQDLELLERRDTSDVWRQLAIWILADPKHGVKNFTKPDSHQYDAITKIAQLYIHDWMDIELWKAYANDVIMDHPNTKDYYASCCAYYLAKAAYSSGTNYIGPISFYADVAGKAAEEVAKNNIANKLLELIKSAPPKETI